MDSIKGLRDNEDNFVEEGFESTDDFFFLV